MSEAKMDAAILTSMHNVAYFSNFVYTSMGRSYALVVTPEKSVTVSALVDGAQPWRTTFGENLAYTDWGKNNFLSLIHI